MTMIKPDLKTVLRALVVSFGVLPVLGTSASAQMLTLDPDGFGTLPELNNQAKVVDYSRPEMVGFEPALQHRRGQAGRIVSATGLLDLYLANGKRRVCTGVLIDEKAVLTNEHCFPAEEGGGRVVQAYFFLGYFDGNKKGAADRVRVDPRPLERKGDPLDYAIVQLWDAPKSAKPVRFTVRDPDPKEPLFLAGHPQGWPMQVTRGLCRTANIALDQQSVNHLCNTYGGSSGSLIFADGERDVAVALHKAGPLLKGEANRATRLTEIAAVSPILARLVGMELRNAPRAVDVAKASPIDRQKACDRVAAHPYNPDNPSSVSGVDWTDLNAEIALEYCKAAAEVLTDHSRIKFQLARAYQKAGQFKEAAALLQEGEQEGYAASIYNLGGLYERGNFVSKDLRKAQRLYERSAELGHATGAIRLGNWLRNGVLTGQDYDRAMKYFQQAHKLGHTEAAAKIGYMFGKGFGVTKSEYKALEYYEISAARHVGWAERNLAWTLAFGPKDLRDYPRAMELFERAVVNGSAKKAHANLGHIYEQGLGLPQDLDRAKFHYEAAVQAGNVRSLLDLGDLYRDRKNPDPQVALQYYEQAIAGGEAEGIAKIAYLYDSEMLVAGTTAQTHQKAANLYQDAADEGIAWAMRNLGYMYHYGNEFEKNLSKAAQYYKAAIKADSVESKTRLAKLYLSGEWPNPDGRQARKLLEEAHEAGNSSATAVLIGVLGTYPPVTSALDPDRYQYTDWDDAKKRERFEQDLNQIISWAQMIGIYKGSVTSRTSVVDKTKVVKSLEPLLEQAFNGRPAREITAAHQQVKALLADFIVEMEANPTGQHWFRLNVGSTKLFQALYYNTSNADLQAADRDMRNRLLRVYGIRMGKWNPQSSNLENGRPANYSVKNYQSALQNTGLYKGAIDGDNGPKTRAAITAFQRAIGLPVTGKVDAETYWALNGAWEAQISF